ncbi:MAG: hypothetical protein ABIL09_29860, partial [Gemmatimonadota bacterium]
MGMYVYGAPDGVPGIRLEELTTPRPPQPGSIGSSVIVGAFRRGPVGGPNVPPVAISSLSDLWRRRGVKVANHYAEQACRGFLKLAEGSGTLHTVRVCDGSEVASTWTLLTRRCPRGVLCRNDDTLTPTALTVVSEWPGRDAGKQKVLGGLLALLADVGATTVATGQTMLLNELAGGTLTLRGVSSRTYVIASNTTAGVITVQTDDDMAADIAADTP